MEHSHNRPPEMLYQRRERLLRSMVGSVGMFFELEKKHRESRWYDTVDDQRTSPIA